MRIEILGYFRVNLGKTRIQKEDWLATEQSQEALNVRTSLQAGGARFPFMVRDLRKNPTCITFGFKFLLQKLPRRR